jgi:DNA-binding CsgD family transcriptional regulator
LIGLHRAVGERPFSFREVSLLHVFHEELSPLIGEPPFGAARLHQLSPRLRQTLACLLEGDGEKQVAIRLHLSVPTVHQYVTTLYRTFGVNSRAELLAHFIRWPAALSHSDDRGQERTSEPRGAPPAEQ